jgi:hypothetical protein
MLKAIKRDLLPALIEDGMLQARDAALLASYWDERDSDAVNLEVIGYWLALRGSLNPERGGTVRAECTHP